MFTNSFKIHANKALVFGALALFFLSTASALLFAGMSQGKGMLELPGCPLMSHSMSHESGSMGSDGQVLCPMSLDTHFAKLGVMMSTTLEILSVLALLLMLAWFAARASAFLVIRLFGPPLTRTSRFAFAQVHASPRDPRLQQAFSRGILHSKAY